MTATTEILIVCDGLKGQGCPFSSQTRVQADYKANARKQLSSFGWEYMRTTNEAHNVRHLDVCHRCTDAVRLMKM